MEVSIANYTITDSNFVFRVPYIGPGIKDCIAIFDVCFDNGLTIAGFKLIGGRGKLAVLIPDSLQDTEKSILKDNNLQKQIIKLVKQEFKDRYNEYVGMLRREKEEKKKPDKIKKWGEGLTEKDVEDILSNYPRWEDFNRDGGSADNDDWKT